MVFRPNAVNAQRRGSPVMTRHFVCPRPWPAVFLFATLLRLPLSAQLPETPQPIPVSEVTESLQKTSALLRSATERALPLPKVAEIESVLPKFATGVKAFLADSRTTLAASPSRRVLRELGTTWDATRKPLDDWQSTLKDRTQALQTDLTALRQESAAWSATSDAAKEQELPPDIVTQIRQTLAELQQAQQAVISRRNEILRLQNRISELQIEIDAVTGEISAAVGKQRTDLVQLDSPPIWNPASAPAQPQETMLAKPEAEVTATETLKYYLRSMLAGLEIQFAAVVAVLIVLLLNKRRAAGWTHDEDPNVRALGLVVKRPFAASLLLTVLVSAVLRGRAPQSVLSVAWFLMLIPLLRLLPGIFSNEIKPALWLLALLYVADRSLLFFPKGSLAVRWAIMFLAAAAAVALVWLDRRLRAHRSPGGWLTTALVFVRLAIAALAIAFLAEVVGATTLSRFLEAGVLRTIYGAVFLYGAMLILQGLMTVILRSRHLESSQDLMDRFASGLNFIGLAVFLMLVLRAFRLRDTLTAWLETVLGRNISLGAFQFSLGSAAIFVLLVAASFLISKILRFFLSASIYSRLDLQRGSAESVSRLLHYTVICCGFLLALGAAGIELSKLTVLVGAFGVGLGLGMQNIVGNFVSGIILLFERPLHVGDKISVGATSGEVMDIGIRASTIRTWDGADVIVPNGSLLANEVTNWTLSDMRRRSELRVGVAYGTDPERVIQLLKETTLDNPDILKQPEPAALFIGFGDSSLDFVLRYWTLIDRHVEVNSQLYVAVNRRLAKEGIEIPFPQRDVNLRPPNTELQDSPPPKPAGSNG